MMGSYAIVGAHLPIALGAAWSAQYRKSGQVAVCFFGDGTTNIGAFHEALNLAAVWKAPVVFVCENNQYMEYTPIGAVTAVAAAGRRSGRGVRAGADRRRRQRRRRGATRSRRRAIARARAGDGPSLVEALTYRHGGHSRADPGKYRPDDEVAAWMARDPIPRAPRRAPRRGRRRGGELDAIDARRATAVAAAEAEARAAPEPSPDASRRRSGPTAARHGGTRHDGELTYRAAVAAGDRPGDGARPSVVFIGEDVGAAGGVFKLDRGAVRPVRAGAGPRHADQRAGDRRRGRWAPR